MNYYQYTLKLYEPNCVIEYDDPLYGRRMFLTEVVRDKTGKDNGVGVCPFTWEAISQYRTDSELIALLMLANTKQEGLRAVAYNSVLKCFEVRLYDDNNKFKVLFETKQPKPLSFIRYLRAKFFFKRPKIGE